MKANFKNRVTMLVLIIAGVISLSSCMESRKNIETHTNEQNTESQVGADDVDKQTPDVIFTGEKGDTVSLKSLKGKVVFLNFWATWCPPCIEEMPSINTLKQSFKGNDNIVFLMVDVDGNIEKSTSFMQNNKYDLPVYIPQGDIPGNFLGSAIPTTVILAKNGDMVARMEGGRDYTSLEMVKALNELVQSH